MGRAGLNGPPQLLDTSLLPARGPGGMTLREGTGGRASFPTPRGHRVVLLLILRTVGGGVSKLALRTPYSEVAVQSSLQRSSTLPHIREIASPSSLNICRLHLFGDCSIALPVLQFPQACGFALATLTTVWTVK